MLFTCSVKWTVKAKYIHRDINTVAIPRIWMTLFTFHLSCKIPPKNDTQIRSHLSQFTPLCSTWPTSVKPIFPAWNALRVNSPASAGLMPGTLPAKTYTSIYTYSIYAAYKHEEMHGECGKHRAALSTRSFWKENRHIVRVKKKKVTLSFVFTSTFKCHQGDVSVCEKPLRKWGSWSAVSHCWNILKSTSFHATHTEVLFFPIILLKQWSDSIYEVKASSSTSMSAFYLDNTAPWKVSVSIAAQIIWLRMPRLPQQILISIFEIGADVPSWLLKSQWRTSAGLDYFTEFSTLTPANIYGRC